MEASGGSPVSDISQENSSSSERRIQQKLNKNTEIAWYWKFFGLGFDIFFRISPIVRHYWRPQRRDGIVKNPEVKDEIGWVELFIDLLFVAQFISLSESLAYCHFGVNEIFGFVFINFMVFFGVRQQIDEYFNRFSLPNSIGRPVMLWYSLGIFFMSINTPRGTCYGELMQTHVYNGWIVGFIMTRTTLIIMYLHVMYHDPLTRKQFSLHLILQCTVISLILVDVMAFYLSDTHKMGYGSEDRYGLIPLLCIGFLDMFSIYFKIFPIIFRKWLGLSREYIRSYLAIPENLEKMQERFGVFVSMVLGEVVLTIATQPMNRIHGPTLGDVYTLLVGAFILCGSLGMVYFEEVQRKDENVHKASKVGVVYGATWCALHSPLTYAIFIIGISLKAISYQINLYSKLEDFYYLAVLDAAIGIAHCTMVVMSSLHVGIVGERYDKPIWAWNRYSWWNLVRLIIALMHFCISPAYHVYDWRNQIKYVPFIHSIIIAFHRLLLKFNKHMNKDKILLAKRFKEDLLGDNLHGNFSEIGSHRGSMMTQEEERRRRKHLGQSMGALHGEISHDKNPTDNYVITKGKSTSRFRKSQVEYLAEKGDERIKSTARRELLDRWEQESRIMSKTSKEIELGDMESGKNKKTDQVKEIRFVNNESESPLHMNNSEEMNKIVHVIDSDDEDDVDYIG
jgi:low temperature requirement protein LtrA